MLELDICEDASFVQLNGREPAALHCDSYMWSNTREHGAAMQHVQADGLYKAVADLAVVLIMQQWRCKYGLCVVPYIDADTARATDIKGARHMNSIV